MKNKKILSLVAALAIAIPMTAPMNMASPVFAESVEFVKEDENNSGNGVKGAVYDFYEIKKDGTSDKKIFTATTNENGKLDSKSVVVRSGNFSNSVVDTNGNLNLPAGSYYVVETKAPNNYMINTSTELFTVTEGGMSSINTSDRKFTTDKGQLIIRSSDKKNGSAVPGADIDLLEKDTNGKYNKIASFLSDVDGYMILLESANNIEMYNGTVVLPEGEYKVIESNIEGNYSKITKEFPVVMKKGTTYRTNFAHDTKGTTGGGNTQTPGDNDNLTIKDEKTGFKLKIISSKTKNALSNIGIEVYSKNSSQKKVYSGKTNTYGYLDSEKATVGKYITKNNILYLEPGEYYYKFTNSTTGNKYDFTVVKDQIKEETRQVNSSSGLDGSTGTSNVKKGTSSPSSSSKLAKTGFVNNKVFAFAGLSLVFAGIAISASKKKKK